MIQEVYLIDNDDKIKDKLVKMFEKEEDYKFKKAKTHEIDTVLRNIPALIIINEDMQLRRFLLQTIFFLFIRWDSVVRRLLR